MANNDRRTTRRNAIIAVILRRIVTTGPGGDNLPQLQLDDRQPRVYTFEWREGDAWRVDLEQYH